MKNTVRSQSRDALAFSIPYRRRILYRWLFVPLLLLGILAGVLFPSLTMGPGLPVRAAPQAQTIPDHIVISEFRTSGPGGSTDEFIELFNPTDHPIPLDGWVVLASDNAGTMTKLYTFPPPGIALEPGQHFLLGSPGYAGTHDATYDALLADMADDGGIALFLADGTTSVDQVGLSSGSAYKEQPVIDTLTTDPAQAYERKLGGSLGSCTDTQNNSDDFALISPSHPQNLSSGLTLCVVPPLTVLINEIAWAGTAISDTDEWIELYNPGSSSVNLNGWRLVAADGSPDIALIGTVDADDYFLLERSDDTTISDIIADHIFTEALSNSGESLQLLSPNGIVVDTANIDGGAWPAGSSYTYGSMERFGVNEDSPFVWTTNDGTVSNGLDADGNPIRGTPRQPNSAIPPTSTSTATNTPTAISELSILINEVAWAGTAISDTDEWIELYNPGSSPINFSGWRLVDADGSPDISLSGTIPADGYFLLERSDDTTISDILADQIFTGALSNSGESLQLLSPNSTVVDTANNDGGAWPAGSSYTYGSMERRGVIADSSAAWITNTGVIANGLDADGNPLKGTPKQPNWAYSVTPTPFPTATIPRTPTVTPTPTLTRTPTRVPTYIPKPVVVINEILPRAGHDWNGDGKVDVYDEFIEIKNIGYVNVDLYGWKLDDEANLDSKPYTLPGVKLKPGQWTVFYRSVTKISLSDGGDTVRLLNTYSTVVDAYTYTVVKSPDQSLCRLPDGRSQWEKDCFPTPKMPNAKVGTFPPTIPGSEEFFCSLPDTVPDGVRQAECLSPGKDIFNVAYWDDPAEYIREIWLDNLFKWAVWIR